MCVRVNFVGFPNLIFGAQKIYTLFDMSVDDIGFPTVTYAYMRHDSFIHEMYLIHTSVWNTHMCDMTY